MNTKAIQNAFYDVETIPERAEQNQLNELRKLHAEKKASFERAKEVERLTKEMKTYEPPSKAQKVAKAIGGTLKQIGGAIDNFKVSRKGIKAGTLQANQNKQKNNMLAFYSRFGEQKTASQKSQEFFNKFNR